MASVEVLDTQEPFGGSVAFLDIKGNLTNPDDVPQWSSDNETVATVSADESGLSGIVTLTGTLGAAVISVDSTDTDGTQIHAEGTVTVKSSEAVSGSVTFDVPDTATATPPALAETTDTAATSTSGDTTVTPTDEPEDELNPNQPL